MFYTIIWLIVFLIAGGHSLSVGEPAFWGLLVAIIADILWNGYFRRQPFFR